MTSPIFLFTDFGITGPYVGQMHGAIRAIAGTAPIIDLMHDAPAMNPKASAYLLAAVLRDLPEDAVVVAVVDPGVGTSRDALMVTVDGRRLVGPDNGLLEIAMRQSLTVDRKILQWRPTRLSASFHGRDLFAPAAALWVEGEIPTCTQTDPFPKDRPGHGWPDDLGQVIYIDAFGNAMTGLRTMAMPDPARLTLPDGTTPIRARTFADVPKQFGFWYENSLGLAEIAVNGGSAARTYNLHIGDAVHL